MRVVGASRFYNEELELDEVKFEGQIGLELVDDKVSAVVDDKTAAFLGRELLKQIKEQLSKNDQ